MPSCGIIGIHTHVFWPYSANRVRLQASGRVADSRGVPTDQVRSGSVRFGQVGRVGRGAGAAGWASWAVTCRPTHPTRPTRLPACLSVVQAQGARDPAEGRLVAAAFVNRHDGQHVKQVAVGQKRRRDTRLVPGRRWARGSPAGVRWRSAATASSGEAARLDADWGCPAPARRAARRSIPTRSRDAALATPNSTPWVNTVSPLSCP